MSPAPQRGFSLLELMIVVLLLMLVTGVVFSIISSAISRSGTEQAKLDMFQAAREFMDQMSRDLHQAGYPNPQNFVRGVLGSPPANNPDTAVGLVNIATGDLWFEADVEGTGVVSVIRYHLDTSTESGCPCLKRSQMPKMNGHPLTGQTEPDYQVEVHGVQNTNIFSAYVKGATGSPITLPVDFAAQPAAIATIDTVQAILTIQSTHVDVQTREQPVATLISTVRLNNCSQAKSGLPMSCR